MVATAGTCEEEERSWWDYGCKARACVDMFGYSAMLSKRSIEEKFTLTSLRFPRQSDSRRLVLTSSSLFAYLRQITRRNNLSLRHAAPTSPRGMRERPSCSGRALGPREEGREGKTSSRAPPPISRRSVPPSSHRIPLFPSQRRLDPYNNFIDFAITTSRKP